MTNKLYAAGTVIDSGSLNDFNTATYDRLTAVAGTNTVTATGPLSMTAYVAGQNFWITPAVTNTGATTLNVNGLGARNVLKNGASALVAGDLVAGTIYEVLYDGTSFQLLNPSMFPVPVGNIIGTVPVANGGTGITSLLPAGQCVLDINGGNIRMLPYQGNKIAFPAGYATVPNAGVTLAVTGAAASTFYYIYAVQTAGVVTSMEFSTTARATDATTGIQIKNGDNTRVLVAAARTTAGTAWANTAAQRFLINWFNPKPIDCLNAFTTADRSTGSTTYVQLGSAAERVEFLTWSDKAVSLMGQGFSFNTTAGVVGYTVVAIDGTVQDGGSTTSTRTIGDAYPFAIGASRTLAEGYHYAEIYGRVTGGTGSWKGVTLGERCTLQGTIFG